MCAALNRAEPRSLGCPQPGQLRRQGWLPAAQRVTQGPCGLDHTETRVRHSVTCLTGDTTLWKSRGEHSLQGVTDNGPHGPQDTGTGSLRTWHAPCCLLTAPAVAPPTGGLLPAALAREEAEGAELRSTAPSSPTTRGYAEAQRGGVTRVRTRPGPRLSVSLRTSRNSYLSKNTKKASMTPACRESEVRRAGRLTSDSGTAARLPESSLREISNSHFSLPQIRRATPLPT